jgi:hypothetical protein
MKIIPISLIKLFVEVDDFFGEKKMMPQERPGEK